MAPPHNSLIECSSNAFELVDNDCELLENSFKQQALADNAYLAERMEQVSKMSPEQLEHISFSLAQADLEGFCSNSIYVDKTQQILRALNKGWVFLVRPRRMGKSLTLSTISLMSLEVYKQSIYPKHQLHPVLKDTFFASIYSDAQLSSNQHLGAPYNINISFKNIAVSPELQRKAQKDKEVADAKKKAYETKHNIENIEKESENLRQQKSHLDLQQKTLEQEFTENFAYKALCEMLKRQLTSNPNLQKTHELNIDYSYFQDQLHIDRIKILQFLFALDQITDSSNCQIADTITTKLAEINGKLSQISEQLNGLTEQIRDVDLKLNNFKALLGPLKSEFALNVKTEDVLPYTSYEKIGLLRKSILEDLCDTTLSAINRNSDTLSELKSEIMANSSCYQKGLDLIEQQMQLNLKRQDQVNIILADIKNSEDLKTSTFSLTIGKILSLFKEKDLSFFIDEYDACLVDNLDNKDIAEYVRKVMEEFYTTLKDYTVCQHIRILFVTGVTAYAKVSLFSGANNINDISYDPDFYDIVGFTEHEIKRNFADILCKHALLQRCKPQDIIANLALHYDGYHFALPNPDTFVQPIFNPLSVLKSLESKTISYQNYWSTSGSGLSKTVLQFLTQISIDELTQAINQALNGGIELIVYKNSYDIFYKISFSAMQQNAVFLMYQAGYLTIDFKNSIHKQYLGAKLDENIQRVVVLTPPNQEVRSFLANELTTLVINYNNWKFGESFESLISSTAQKRLSILEQGRLTLILKAFADYTLSACEHSFNLMLGRYATDINNQALWENFLRNILFTCIQENINASGNNELLHAETEVPVNGGRIDLMVTNERNKTKFVFEFKRIEESDPNLPQIETALNIAANQMSTHNYSNQIGYKVIAIAGAFFRNIKEFAPNPYSLGYHICLDEVSVGQN